MAVDYRQLCLEIFKTDDPDELRAIGAAVKKNKKGRPVKITAEVKQEICILRGKGVAINKIAKKYGVTRQLISKILNPPIAEGCTLRLKYLYKNMICTLIDVDFENKRVFVINRTDDLSMRAFGDIDAPTWNDFYKFLERRSFARDYVDLAEILDIFGMQVYDPLVVVERLQGRNKTDDMHIEFVYKNGVT